MFRYYSCLFKYEENKKKTARIVFWKDLNIINCYTLEASLHCHFNENR
jgi:hypothetical protein